ncbi:hypothetical protein CC80DRAFT_550641 [Byssothecium circinans]|uniref:Chromo domain-containing protein n=1 Tax=Byssothecium circinans TaxID=147558 RepID=A0A6A5TMT3_9PLEO|nr:hypothetical protein CC80DRAFT_550641 [Byssothecium circinans]
MHVARDDESTDNVFHENSPVWSGEYEATYQGDYSGMRLLKKRVLRGKVEYFVEWKGRPESENSWEKEATVSREHIKEYEVS